MKAFVLGSPTGCRTKIAMDTEFARTFLAVIETGSFVKAAERVHLTQSTVSMRIKTLEDQVGKQLFERTKSGVVLTAEGERFQKHASGLVRMWEQARHELALPSGYKSLIKVGGQYSIWDDFLLTWAAQMRNKWSDVAVRTSVGFSDDLMKFLIAGFIDLGVMYRPESHPGFEVELLYADELIHVTSEADSSEVSQDSYIFVDWGPQFRADHGLHLPDLSMPGLYMEVGSLALDYILRTPASGYFPRRRVKDHLTNGQLKIVPEAPTFSYPVYVVYSVSDNSSALVNALQVLKECTEVASQNL
jgi:DNA-binding transcriptional LysR family regulator